jgi:inner membrane protein
MDSITQIALGAAIGTATLGRKAGARAALWGALFGTLPDLDVLMSYGDPVRDFTFHRAESHSLFWLTVASPILAALPAQLHRAAGAGFCRWWLLAWLVLVTHPLLDAFTVYGTQLLLPFSDYPFGIGSVFIVDPLYTLPLIFGVIAAMGLHRRSPGRALRWNAVGIALSTAYLVWSVAAQAHVEGVVNRALAIGPLAKSRVLVTPTPLNTLLWRVVVMEPDGYHEGFYSLFDDDTQIALVRHQSDPTLLAPLQDDWAVRRLAWFSKGFFGVSSSTETQVARGSASTLRQLLGLVETAAAADTPAAPSGTPVIMTDLRMGQTPWFVFAFVVAEHAEGRVRAVPPRQVPAQRPPPDALHRLWRRIWDTSR